MKAKILKPIWAFEDDFKVSQIYEAKRGEDGYIWLKNPYTEEFDSVAFDEEVEVILED